MKDHGNVLIHVTGADHPGILYELTSVFSKWEVGILDVQQTTSLRQLSLSLLLGVPYKNSLQILGEITQTIRKESLSVDITILAEKTSLRDMDFKIFALTMLSNKIETEWFHALVGILSKYCINIERMNQLAQGKLQCIEFVIALNEKNLKKIDKISGELFQIAIREGFSLAIQPENLFRHSKRLIVMDIDSTLIKQEVVDELAESVGMKDKVSEITLRTMEGQLSFRESLEKRVSLLKGLSVSSLEKVKDKIQLTPGAESLISCLKKLGFKIGVISGGFTYFSAYLKESLKLDYHFANELEIVDGLLTGRLKGEIIDRAKKSVILKQLAEREKISLNQTIAIGDGVNDLDMLATAGLGIAFNAKQKVIEEAKAFLRFPDLASVLFLLGVSERELSEMS